MFLSLYFTTLIEKQTKQKFLPVSVLLLLLQFCLTDVYLFVSLFVCFEESGNLRFWIRKFVEHSKCNLLGHPNWSIICLFQKIAPLSTVSMQEVPATLDLVTHMHIGEQKTNPAIF